MAYEKQNWADRTVERPLTFTFQSNADGSTTLIPAEGTIITTGTPLTAEKFNHIEDALVDQDGRITTNAGAINDLDGRLDTAESTLASKVAKYYTDTDGSIVMQRASTALAGTIYPNGNFLIGIQDTAHAQQYIIAIAHFQANSNFRFTVLASNVLTAVTNTLGTIAVSGNSGTPKFTIIHLGVGS